MLGATLMLIVCAWIGLLGAAGQRDGAKCFSAMHMTMLVIMWLVVPFLTSDSLSREVREGTLPLLFLTPLRARDIVTSKAMALGWRVFTIWLAVIPVLSIPLLMGGVDWREVLMSVELNFSSMLLALGAGLLASSWCRRWVRAMALTMVLCFLLAPIYSLLHVFTVAGIVSIASPSMNFGQNPRISELCGDSFVFLTNAGQEWSQALQSLSAVERKAWLVAEAASVVLSFGLFMALVNMASRRVSRCWQSLPRSARAEKLERAFLQPVVWRSLLRRWMKRKLERNPVGWLGHRTWSGRLVIWSWFGIVTVVYCGGLPAFGFSEEFESMQRVMAWLLLGSLAVSAAGSFQRERENGVLELLLVAPLSESQIIGGRLRGLWGQFMPAIVLLLGVWIYSRALQSRGSFGWTWRGAVGWAGSGAPSWDPTPGVLLFFCASFVALPMVGLYYSLIRRTFFGAFVSTMVFAVVLAPLISSAFQFYTRGFYLGLGVPGMAPPFIVRLRGFDSATVIEIGIGVIYYFRLREIFRQRRFAFNRSQ
jgi:ABC-type transport system involved in multi-copper enzyme maturation permease subunit